MKLINPKKWRDFWLISLIFFFIIKITTSLLITIFFRSDLNNTAIDNIYNQYFTLLLSILIAPILETFIFFKLVLIGLNYFKHIKVLNRYNFNLFVLISSILFSVNHFYNISYLINGLISGILYSIIYYKSYIKKYSPFIGTALIHSAYNLFVFYWKS